jgi:hypothetical protein
MNGASRLIIIKADEVEDEGDTVFPVRVFVVVNGCYFTGKEGNRLIDDFLNPSHTCVVVNVT